MKTKIFTMLIATAMMVCSCSKNDDDKSAYTNEQQKVLSIMNGVYTSDPDMAGATRIITFVEQYPNTPKLYTISGGSGERKIHCVYELSYSSPIVSLQSSKEAVSINSDGKFLVAYRLLDSNKLGSASSRKIEIKSNTEFHLWSEGFAVPTVFKRR